MFYISTIGKAQIHRSEEKISVRLDSMDPMLAISISVAISENFSYHVMSYSRHRGDVLVAALICRDGPSSRLPLP